MLEIDTDHLDTALSALNDQLAFVGAQAHLVVIGGSGLIAIGAAGRTTRDVDILALEHDGVLVSAEPLPRAIVEAAAVVARDLGLEPNWLNPGPTSLLSLGLPAGFAGRVIRRDYGTALGISFASRIDQIYFKVYAAADRREPRDFADLRRLDPTARGASRRRALGSDAQPARSVRRCNGERAAGAGGEG
jgi:hypothetical protein